jgi:hypothetical protein
VGKRAVKNEVLLVKCFWCLTTWPRPTALASVNCPEQANITVGEEVNEFRLLLVAGLHKYTIAKFRWSNLVPSSSDIALYLYYISLTMLRRGTEDSIVSAYQLARIYLQLDFWNAISQTRLTLWLRVCTVKRLESTLIELEIS